ncbi:adenosylhomocysteinase-like [Neltuma alba]|uniref:adenosylhomocysteinase-like n=1 Tax=Neltuma alba TaxID=207710 RepID=UPI0010A59854|nr:adenosylhomocysteinase-like [Prosopis alba]
MVLATEKTKLLSLADFSRLLAQDIEVDMSGLMACSDEFVLLVPLRGPKIAVFSAETTRNDVISTALTDMGAEVRRCFRNISPASAPEGKTLEEYWRGIDRALDCGPDLIVDDCGDATLLIHEGVKAEKIYARTGQLPNPSLADTAEFQIVLTIIRDGLNSDSTRYRNMKDRLVGVTVETTAGIDRLNRLQANGALLFPAINVNHCFTKSMFSESTDFLYALFNGIREATNRMIPVTQAVVCGYEDASEGYAIALKQAGAKVAVLEVDPNLATQAVLRGFSVVKTLDDVVSKADVLVISCNNMNNIAAVKLHLKKMKNDAIIYDVDSILSDHSNNALCWTQAHLKGQFSRRQMGLS